MSLNVVLEFVDGDARSDINTQKILDYNFIKVVAALLNFNYYDPQLNDYEENLKKIESVIKFNF